MPLTRSKINIGKRAGCKKGGQAGIRAAKKGERRSYAASTTDLWDRYQFFLARIRRDLAARRFPRAFDRVQEPPPTTTITTTLGTSGARYAPFPVWWISFIRSERLCENRARDGARERERERKTRLSRNKLRGWREAASTCAYSRSLAPREYTRCMRFSRADARAIITAAFRARSAE